MSNELSSAKTVLDIVEQLNKLYKALGPFRPETKGLRINYRERTSDLSLRLSVPDTVKRRLRNVEIPAYTGYTIHEIFDESLNRVDYAADYKDGKWVLHADRLPASEKFLAIMKGRIHKDALDHIVKVHAPEDPKKEEKLDKYWVHCTIKDRQILKQIWKELAIEQVNLGVRVGVQRYFTTAIPRQITMMLRTRRRLLDAIERGQRERSRLESQYRYWKRIAGISTSDIYDLIRKLLTGEAFSSYISVDNPYEISSIEPVVPTFLIPERVGVSVQTDLSYQRPAANGCLSFQKQDFSSTVSEAFEKFLAK